MSGTICLQGGAEFGDACRDMDAGLLARSGGGPVVVAPFAARSSAEFQATGRHAVHYLHSLGAEEVSVTPEDPDEAARSALAARLLVLPGGSPRKLLATLADTAMGEAVSSVRDAGGVVMGASAGAMVLCGWTLVPNHGGGPTTLARGLGLVPDALVLPHFTGDTRWLDEVRGDLPPDVLVLGLPECGGVLLENGTLTAVGAGQVTLLGRTNGVLEAGDRYRLDAAQATE